MPATNQALIELMDRLAEGSSEEELARLTDIFVNCSRYEKGFWDMAWEMRAMSMLEFSHVSYQYPSEDFDIIDDLSFSVEPGSFHCIIGVSGCGKSTIFRMTNGLLRPQSGTIQVGGAPIEGQKRYCGYMPQRDLLFPWRTVGENVGLPLEIMGGLLPGPDAGSRWRRLWRTWAWRAAPASGRKSSPAACGSGRPLPGPCSRARDLLAAGRALFRPGFSHPHLHAGVAAGAVAKA